MTRRGVVTASVLNVRSGPGSEYPVRRQLARGARVEVVGQEGNWRKLRVDSKYGFAHKNFIFVPETTPPQGFLRERDTLRMVALPAPPAQQLALRPKATPQERLVVEIWNRCGGLLRVLSNEVKIEPGASVAVLCVESSGKGFGPGGRLKIRFENHVFWKRWALKNKRNQQTFEQHLCFDPDKPWLRHRYRLQSAGSWKSVHRSQATEWEVLGFARTLDDTQALCSISMGSLQIMGFNHASVGYQTVQEMFKAFSDAESGERDQIIGLFDFIKGPGDLSAMTAALQRNDFLAFASRYNGPAKAFEYGEQIEGYRAIFLKLSHKA